MISVRAYGTAPPQCAVHRARQTDGQTAEAPGERGTVFGLHDQMQVVVLDAEVHDAKAVVRRSG